MHTIYLPNEIYFIDFNYENFKNLQHQVSNTDVTLWSVISYQQKGINSPSMFYVPGATLSVVNSHLAPVYNRL